MFHGGTYRQSVRPWAGFRPALSVISVHSQRLICGNTNIRNVHEATIYNKVYMYLRTSTLLVFRSFSFLSAFLFCSGKSLKQSFHARLPPAKTATMTACSAITMLSQCNHYAFKVRFALFCSAFSLLPQCERSLFPHVLQPCRKKRKTYPTDCQQDIFFTRLHCSRTECFVFQIRECREEPFFQYVSKRGDLLSL